MLVRVRCWQGLRVIKCNIFVPIHSVGMFSAYKQSTEKEAWYHEGVIYTLDKSFSAIYSRIKNVEGPISAVGCRGKRYQPISRASICQGSPDLSIRRLRFPPSPSRQNNRWTDLGYGRANRVISAYGNYLTGQGRITPEPLICARLNFPIDMNLTHALQNTVPVY